MWSVHPEEMFCYSNVDAGCNKCILNPREDFPLFLNTKSTWPASWDRHLHHTIVAHRKELGFFQGSNLLFQNGQNIEQSKYIGYLMLRIIIII